jgi:Membrane bound beta barrel domain (DUF5777)
MRFARKSRISSRFDVVRCLLNGSAVTRICSWSVLTALTCSLAVSVPRAAFAQDPQPPSAPQAQAAASTDEDDDAAFRPLEPDFSLINLPTTLPLPLHKSNFHLTHRFGGNLRGRDFGDVASDFFGIDEGATIDLEYRFAIAKHLEIGASRTNFARTIEFFGKYDAFHQNTKNPVGISGLVSIEGTNNFRQEYAPALGASVSRTIGSVLAVYGVPVWVHNSAASTGVMRDTFMVGVGGRLRVLKTVFVVGEVTPRVAGYRPGENEYGFGLEKRVGGHDFMLTFTNSFVNTYGQIARGGNPDSLYLGFNLSRKFF